MVLNPLGEFVEGQGKSSLKGEGFKNFWCLPFAAKHLRIADGVGPAQTETTPPKLGPTKGRIRRRRRNVVRVAKTKLARDYAGV